MQANNHVTLKHFASWFILESYFDELCNYLNLTFNSFILREKQTSKIRIEISALLNEHETNTNINNEKEINGVIGEKRKLSTMFAAIEKVKEQLRIEEYSISQTSLEQIFNYFASQVSRLLSFTLRYFFT